MNNTKNLLTILGKIISNKIGLLNTNNLPINLYVINRRGKTTHNITKYIYNLNNKMFSESSNSTDELPYMTNRKGHFNIST